MSSPAVTVPPQLPVKDAAAVLDAHGFTCLPVVTGHGRLVGVVSEKELLADRSRRWSGAVLVVPQPDTDTGARRR